MNDDDKIRRAMIPTRDGWMTEQEYYAKVRLPEPVIYAGQTCKLCQSAGYLRYERPVGHSLFGVISACPACKAPTGRTGEEPWWSK